MHALGKGLDIGTFHVVVDPHTADHGLVSTISVLPVQLTAGRFSLIYIVSDVVASAYGDQ